MQNARAWWTTSVVVLLLMCISSLVVAFGTHFTASAAQTVPHRVHFQGRLVDAAGNPRPDGLYVMNFGFYSSPSGGTWYGDETCQQTDRVQVRNGIFSVQLGSCASTISPSLFSQYPVYVEVQIPTPATATCATAGCANWSEPAMTPRLLVGSSPYALNSDTLDGLDADAFAQVAANNTFTGTTTFRSSTNSTSAFAIQNSAGASLLVADTTNMQLKVGGGDINPNGTPALLVVDHKSTTGDPAGVNGAMYYNAVSKKFRCYEDGVWRDCVSEPTSVRNGLKYYQDFARAVNVAVSFFGTPFTHNEDEGLSVYGTGTSASLVSVVSNTAGRPGVWRLGTGSTATGAVFYYSAMSGSTPSAPYSFGNGAMVYQTAVRLQALSASTQRFTTLHGFASDVAPIGGTNGCYFRYSDAINDGKWQGVCEVAGVESVCDTGSAVTAASWHTLRLAVNASGTEATFVANDTMSCAVTTGIPTTQLGIVGGVAKTVGTTARMIEIDYLELQYETAGR